MYPESPEGTQVIVGSMNMRYISDTAMNQSVIPILTACGVHIIYRKDTQSLCPECVDIWDGCLVRWMCGALLKDKRSVRICSFLDIQIVAHLALDRGN